MKLPRSLAAPPNELDRVVTALTFDPEQILILSGLNVPAQHADLAKASAWQSILIQARARELEKAPQLLDYLTALGGGSLAVVGLLVMTAPVGFLAVAGAVVGVGGGLMSLVGSAKLIRDDGQAMQRLRTIETAELLLAARLDSIRRHNQQSD